jgi:hypothetical protein
VPQTITIAAFVLGSVLILIALVGGGFKIFGAEVSGTAGRVGRAVAGIAGAIFLAIGVFGSFAPAPPQTTAPQPAATANTQIAKESSRLETRTQRQPAEPAERVPKLEYPPTKLFNIAGHWRDETGTDYYVTQQGGNFTFYGNNPYNGARSKGAGSIAHKRITTSFQTSAPSVGTGNVTLSDDGKTMMGTFQDSALGQYNLTIYKVD